MPLHKNARADARDGLIASRPQYSTELSGTRLADESTDPRIAAQAVSDQLMLDGNLYGSSVSITGAATNLPLLTGTLQPGAHVLSIVYSGDGNFSTSSSMFKLSATAAPIPSPNSRSRSSTEARTISACAKAP